MSNIIDSLKGRLQTRNGYARSNRFNVQIVSKDSIDFGNDLEFFCESVTLPSRNISTMEITNEKQTIKIPYTFIDEDVTMVFNLTNDYFIRDTFEKWMAKIINTETYKVGYKKDFSTTVYIRQLDGSDNEVYRVELQEAFPVNISAIDLSNASENSIAQLTVTMSYEQYVAQTI